MTDGSPHEPAHGLKGALARLGAAVLGLLETRLELVTIEYAEERGRLIEALVLVLVSVVSIAFALLAGSALIVAWFWDTHRIAALLAVMLAYLAIGLFALWRLSQSRAADARPFAATLAEIERDRAWVSDNFGVDK